MVTMTINFKEEKLKELGYTAEQLLGQFDEYCSANDILKPQLNVFEKDGIHALADISKIIFEIEKNVWFLNLLDKWYWNIDGKIEDILEDAYYWSKRLN